MQKALALKIKRMFDMENEHFMQLLTDFKEEEPSNAPFERQQTL